MSYSIKKPASRRERGQTEQGKVRLHRYICLWRASERRLNKTPEKEARIKCIQKENVCVEEARRESIKENEKKAVDMSQEVCTRSMVRNKKPEAERASQNQENQENKRSEAEERTGHPQL